MIPKGDYGTGQPFRYKRDWVCDNGGHCVYEEELLAWFGTNADGLAKLLDKKKVFSEKDIDAWIKDELHAQKPAIEKKAKEEVQKENAAEDRRVKERLEGETKKREEAKKNREREKLRREQARDKARKEAAQLAAGEKAKELTAEIAKKKKEFDVKQQAVREKMEAEKEQKRAQREQARRTAKEEAQAAKDTAEREAKEQAAEIAKKKKEFDAKQQAAREKMKAEQDRNRAQRKQALMHAQKEAKAAKDAAEKKAKEKAAEIAQKKADLLQKQQDAIDLKKKQKESLRQAHEADEWRDQLKDEAIAAREESLVQNAIHKRARDTLHKAKVKVALVPESPGNPLGAIRGADVTLSAGYHSEVEAERHVLAIVDVSESMEPLLPDVKSSLKSLVNRKGLNAHLSLYKRVDEAKPQNVAEDKMDVKVGEVVSLDANISAVRIRCGWGNAKGGAACDLDGGIALFTERGPLQQGLCYFERKSLEYDGNLAVTLNTDARGDGDEGAVPGKSGYSREVLVCKLDKLPEEVTTVICYVCCYNGSFENAKDVDICIDDVTDVVQKSGDNATALRNEPGVVLARSSAESVEGLSGRSGLVLGAFNKLPDNTWYFESIQQTATGSDPNATGMREAFNAYVKKMNVDRQEELARRAEAKSAKDRLDVMLAEDSSRREWRVSNPLKLKGEVLKLTGNASDVNYLGEPGEHVTGPTLVSVFDALKEECDNRENLTRPWPAHQMLSRMVMQCADGLASTDKDHHITVVWVTSKDHELDGKLFHSLQSKIALLAFRRVFVRVCVTGISVGHEFASGKHVNALSALTFDINLRNVEAVSRGDGSVTRPPMWAKLNVADAITDIAENVVDVKAYLQLRLDVSDNCKIPITAVVKDDLAGFGDPAMHAVRCLPGTAFDLAPVAAMINNPGSGPKPSLVWNDHRPSPPPMTRAALVEWLRKQLCLLFLSTENPGPAVSSFYWGHVSKVKVAHMLNGQLDGSYLLQKSKEGDQPYILSVVCNGHIRDVEISSVGRACRWNFRNVAFPDDEPCETMADFINRHKTEPLIFAFKIGTKTYHDQVLLRNPRPVPRTHEVDPALSLDKVDGEVRKEAIQLLMVEMSSAWFNPARGGVDGKRVLAKLTDKDPNGNVGVTEFLKEVADIRLKSCSQTSNITFDAVAPAAADPVPGLTTYELLNTPWMRPVGTPSGIKYLQAVRMLQASAHDWASSLTNRISTNIFAKEQSLLESYGVTADDEDTSEVIQQAEDAQNMKAGEMVSLDANVTTVRIFSQWKSRDVKCDLDAGIAMYKGAEHWKTCDYHDENKTIGVDAEPQAVQLNKDDQGTENGKSDEIIVCKLDKLPADVTTCICYVVVYESAHNKFKDADDVAIQIDDVSNIAAEADLGTDNTERFRHGSAVATVARSTAAGNAALQESQGFLLGAFNRHDDGSWVFESIQNHVDGDCKEGNKPAMRASFEERAKAFESAKHELAEKREAEKKRREEEAKKRAKETNGATYFAQLSIELARLAEEKTLSETRQNEINETTHAQRVSIANTIWSLFQQDIGASAARLLSQVEQLDGLFVAASKETKAMHFGTFTALDEVTAFIEGHWHPEILEDKGAVDSEHAFDNLHTAKHLFFQSIVDNEEIPFVLGRARAWTVTLKKQIQAWVAAVDAFAGVKLLHLLLHTDLDQAHFRFKNLYGEWLKMRSKEWKIAKIGGIVEAAASMPHRQHEQDADGIVSHTYKLNDSVGDYGANLGEAVKPQTWLQKKSSVPRLEEFHPVMKEEEVVRDREREHVLHMAKVVEAEALVAAKVAADREARRKRMAAVEAKSKAKAEERRQRWADQHTIDKPAGIVSELSEKLSSTHIKVFGFEPGESKEDADDEWGFKEFVPPPPVEKDSAVEFPKHDHEVLAEDEIHITVPMPMGLSFDSDKVGAGYHIKLLSAHGNAIKTGKIKENMRIVCVNGMVIEGVAKSVVMANIRENKQFCNLILKTTHISENPRSSEVRTTVHGTNFAVSNSRKTFTGSKSSSKEKPKTKGGKARAKVGEWFNTLRRKKLQAGEMVAGEGKEVRIVLRTMSFGGGSEFESCQAGQEVTVVRDLPDNTVLCMTEEGKVLLHGNAFVKDLDELDGLELDMFDGGAEVA